MPGSKVSLAPKFRVVAAREDRLGARLCGIASGIKIAEALGCPHFRPIVSG